MEASSSVLVDKSLYKRNNSSVPGFNGGGGGGSSNNTFLFGSANQRRLNIHGAGVGTGPLGSHLLPYAPYPPAAPTYYSLPNPHLFQQCYPPLLPLPISKSLSLPSPSPLAPSTRMAGAAATYSLNKDQKKRRSSPPNPKKDPQRGAARPRKVLPPAATPPAAATLPSKDEKPEEEKGAFTDDVYALSPPPSSLPIPRFFLRPRTRSAPPAASCNAEVFGCGGAADAGASDDLLRLFRL